MHININYMGLEPIAHSTKEPTACKSWALPYLRTLAIKYVFPLLLHYFLEHIIVYYMYVLIILVRCVIYYMLV